MEQLEKLSVALERLVKALDGVCELTSETMPVHKKCKEMKEYADSCLRLVDREIDRLIAAAEL